MKSAYVSSLTLAETKKYKSIAFPSISTGAYGFPIDPASRIALQSSKDFLELVDHIQNLIFVLFDTKVFEAYSITLQSLSLKYL